MRIGIFIDQLVSGGVQKAAIEEAVNLQKPGTEVILYVLVRANHKYKYEDLTKGLKIVYLSDYNPKFFRKTYRIPLFSFLTTLHLLNYFFINRYGFLKKLDFIICHGMTTCFTLAPLCRQYKIPYLLYVWDPMLYIFESIYGKGFLGHFSIWLQPLIQHFENQFFLGASLIVTSSKVHHEFLKTNYLTDSIIIPPGINIPKPISHDGQTILGFSRWELAKNPQFFLWLAQKLPQAKFVVAGTWNKPHEETYFRSLIAKKNLESRIELRSNLADSELVELARQSLVWIHPNFESFGMAGLEMASFGLPIIIPQGSGVTELFEENIHGYFPKSKDEFLSRVSYLLGNPRIARKMGAAASQKAKQYSWQVHAKTLLNQVEQYDGAKKVVILANSIVATYSTGGGDQLLIELVKRVPADFYLTIITSKPGFYHFQSAQHPNVRFIVVQTLLDNNDGRLAVFFTYLMRSYIVSNILSTIPYFQNLHSATDFIPDVIPAYLIKTRNKFYWTTRIFHIIQNPTARRGNLVVNLVAFFLQKMSLRLVEKSDRVLIDNLSLTNQIPNTLYKKAVLSPGGVDSALLTNVPNNRAYVSDVIFVGRMQEHKGIFEAIRMWANVVETDPEAKLNMVGYGLPSTLNKLKTEIKMLKLEKNVKLLGFIPNRNEFLRTLKSSRILLFLDHEAGFGLTVAEAMAMGKPVVGFDIPIFGSVYKQGFKTFSTYQEQSMALEIVRLLKDQSYYHKFSKEALAESQKFSLDKISSPFFKALISKPRYDKLD